MRMVPSGRISTDISALVACTARIARLISASEHRAARLAMVRPADNGLCGVVLWLRYACDDRACGVDGDGCTQCGGYHRAA